MYANICTGSYNSMCLDVWYGTFVIVFCTQYQISLCSLIKTSHYDSSAETEVQSTILTEPEYSVLTRELSGSNPRWKWQQEEMMTSTVIALQWQMENLW